MAHEEVNPLIDQLMTIPEAEIQPFVEQLCIEGKLTRLLVEGLKYHLTEKAPVGNDKLLRRYRLIFERVISIHSDVNIQAWATWGLSVVESFAENLPKSIELTTQTIKKFLLAEELEEAGILIGNQIANYLESDQLEQGDNFAQSYQETVQLEPLSSVLSRFYWHWGLIKMQMKKPVEAQPFFELAESYLDGLSLEMQERFLFNFASLKMELGQYEEAKKSFYKRLDYFQNQENVNRVLVGVLFYRLAQLHQYMGHLAQALKYADQSISYLSALGIQSFYYIYAILLLAEILLQIGEYDSASTELKRITDEAQPLAQALANLYRGIAYHGLGRSAMATAVLKLCLPEFQKQQSNWYYLAQLQLARVALSEYKETEEHLVWQEGFDFLTTAHLHLLPDTNPWIDSCLLQAEYALQKNDILKAEEWLKKTAVIAQQLPHLETTFTYLQAQIMQKKGKLQEAQKLFAHAWNVSYQIRNMLPQVSLRVSFTAQMAHIQEQLLKTAWQTANWSAFLFYTEAFRSHTLLETVAQELALQQADETLQNSFSQARANYFQACKQIQQETQLLGEESNSVSESNLRQLIREQYEQLKQMRQVLKIDTSIIEIEQLSKSLSSQTVCLLFQKIENKIVVLGVNQAGLQFQKMLETPLETVNDRLDDLLYFEFSEFKEALKEISSYYTPVELILEPWLAQTNHLLHELYQYLWEPIADFLASYKEIVIVPDNTLHDLPFCALYDGKDYILDKHIISYALSATTYTHTYHQTHKRQLADQVTLVAYEGEGANALNYVLQEVEMIQKAVYSQAEILHNRRATPQELKEAAPKTRLLHIASHGDSPKDSPLRSALILRDNEQAHATRFSVYDVAQLNLKQSDLIVLSGCNTGKLTSRGGESLGLTWGFMQAGAYAILANLLPVVDYFTPQIMSLFYQEYETHSHKAKALCFAQRQARQQAQVAQRPFDRLLQHPYLWSSFGLYGYAGQITSTKA